MGEGRLQGEDGQGRGDGGVGIEVSATVKRDSDGDSVLIMFLLLFLSYPSVRPRNLLIHERLVVIHIDSITRCPIVSASPPSPVCPLAHVAPQRSNHLEPAQGRSSPIDACQPPRPGRIALPRRESQRGEGVARVSRHRRLGIVTVLTDWLTPLCISSLYLSTPSAISFSPALRRSNSLDPASIVDLAEQEGGQEMT